MQRIEFCDEVIMIAVTISHPLGPIPMPDLLRHCVYYPSAHLDGDPVKDLGRYFQSFVYVDYGVGEHLVLNDLLNFRGYNQISNRQVCQDGLVPQGWQPPELRPEDGDPTREARFVKPPFAVWAVYDTSRCSLTKMPLNRDLSRTNVSRILRPSCLIPRHSIFPSFCKR